MSRLRRVLLVAFCCGVTLAGLISVRLAVPYLFRRLPTAVAAESALPSGQNRVIARYSAIRLRG